YTTLFRSGGLLADSGIRPLGCRRGRWPDHGTDTGLDVRCVAGVRSRDAGDSLGLCGPLPGGRVAISPAAAVRDHPASGAHAAPARFAGDRADDGSLGVLDSTAGLTFRTRSAALASKPARAGQAGLALPG